MRIFFIVLFISVLFSSCSTTKPDTQTNSKELQFEDNEDGDYDIIVFDRQYEYYLNAVAYPEEFYSKAYYRT